jgi:hypothetical protein
MSSPFVQWLQNLADGIQHNRFLDYQVNTGLYGIPVATFGLVTIAAAVFVHATFSDEITALGGQVYDAAQQGFNRASEMVESSQVAVSEQVNRMGEAVTNTLEQPKVEEEQQPKVEEERPKEEEAERPKEEEEEERPKKEGGRSRRRKTNRKRT